MRARAAALALLALLSAADAVAQPPARPVGPGAVSEAAVYEVATQLRCVVCQNLSVADSPSQMAAQMRDVVRERLAAGATPAAVLDYFVEKYGEWILLAPRRQGLNWLLWLAPWIAVGLGLGLVAWRLHRWTGPGRQLGDLPGRATPRGELPDPSLTRAGQAASSATARARPEDAA